MGAGLLQSRATSFGLASRAQESSLPPFVTLRSEIEIQSTGATWCSQIFPPPVRTRFYIQKTYVPCAVFYVPQLFMRIDLVFPAVPPAHDGIGDHTAHLARELSKQCTVRILTAQRNPTPIPGVEIVSAFSLARPWQIFNLSQSVAENPPDWLVVQFNQFSYGRWGFNPFLPLALRDVRRSTPEVNIAWIAHEDFMPATSLKAALMHCWQRWQFRALGQASDRIFFSIEPWVRKYGPWFPNTPVHHLPIGSNMPFVDEDPTPLRTELDLLDSFVVGLFGTLRARLLDHIDAAVQTLAKEESNVVLLYVGPDGAALRNRLPDARLLDAGRLPAEDVSRHLSIMDIHLTPFIDGVSTRRGSFMAGLQHAVPTVATDGELTDPLLRNAQEQAFLLRPTDDPDAFASAAVSLLQNPTRRQRMGREGLRLYDETFAFEATTPTFLETLKHHPDRTSPSLRPSAVT